MQSQCRVLHAVMKKTIWVHYLRCSYRKSNNKDINHQQKLSAAIVDNFQNLEEFNWPYSRQIRAQVFPWQEINSPWSHAVQNGPVYDAGATMNRPWIVGKRMNPIYDGNDSNRTTLQSIYRCEERTWNAIGDFCPVEQNTNEDSLTYAKDNMNRRVGLENGVLQYGERLDQTNPSRINERPSIISTSDIMEFRRDRTDTELTDPTEDPLLRVKMNKKRPSLVVNEVERQKKSRTGDFYARNQKKLKNYEKNIKKAGVEETVVFEY
ncbi:uncharacterized protein LOC116304167 isoform X2 [Actinia tenebrosa]|uniref:Uncharacterized protein LOC116304167 isoform X2 n=1 Tax=Actinia tenebrosa TaxID=6105 RepID=A0A6P8IU44_ACTTE|nr:uncharacterized protein LOC116304167 isoform X2 [Actinia tenebrosa]